MSWFPFSLRKIFLRVPMPVLAALFGLLATAAVWVVVDPIQSSAIGQVFGEELKRQLEQRARESLLRFDSFLQSYNSTNKLLANHRRMADYLQPVVWFLSDKEPPLIYQPDKPPSWLPALQHLGLPLLPSHILLVDTAGKIREVYEIGGQHLPKDAALEIQQALNDKQRHSYLTKLDGRIYLLVSEQIEDASYYPMGSLVLLAPVDSAFLNASQQRANDSMTKVAILDADNQAVLVASDEAVMVLGEGMAALEQSYVVTAQSFFEYGETPLSLLFATLIPKAVEEETHRRILDVERSHRLTGAAIVGTLFVALFIFISSRISRLLRRLADFSSRALDIETSKPPRGNQLLVMEEWIRSFTQAVMKARESMRARHTAELQERDALQGAVLDASLDPIITIDFRGEIVDFNPTAEQTFGFTSQQAEGRKLVELVIAPGSREAFHVLLNQAFESPVDSREPALRTLYGLNQKGVEFPAEVAIKTVQLESRPLFTVYIRDISERRRQAQEITSLAAFPAESPMPILRANAEGLVLYANDASEPLLAHWGCQRSRRLPDFWQELVAECLDKGEELEQELDTGNGIYSLMFSPVPNQDYANLYGRNVTAERAAENLARHRQNELIHVSRLSTMGEMATGMAHELNQPLSAIANFANGCIRRIRSHTGSEEDLTGALTQIAAQAGRAAEIIKRLRAMVTRQAPVRTVIDLNDLVREVCKLINYQREQLDINLDLLLADEPLMVRVDPVQIEQVLLNILRNALDALSDLAPARRNLSLQSGYLDADRIYLTVRDSGPGIPPSHLQQLFHPFFTTKESGMGVGLSISQTIMNEHQGRIRVESHQGLGTLFSLEFPARHNDNLEPHDA